MRKGSIGERVLKAVVILTLFAMLISVFAACNEKKNPEETTPATEADSGTQADPVNLKDLDFKGATVNILLRSGEQYRREWSMDYNTDSLSQEIFYRNSAVENELGVHFNFIVRNEGDNCTEFSQAIVNSAMGGLGEYDVVNHYAAYATTPDLMQFYKDFNSTDLGYLDLKQPYWNQHFREAAESFGHLFVMVGDVNLSVYDRSIVTFFNKALLEQYHIDPDQLYQDVLDGNWTYEKLYNYVKDVYKDNDESGTKNQPDFFGLTTIAGSEDTDGFLYSFGGKLTENNSDGTHTLISGNMLEKLDSAMGKVQTLYESAGAYRAYGDPNGTWNNALIFSSSRALFDIDVIYHYSAQNQLLRNMKDKYGMIFVPKYDEEQTAYYTGVQDAHNVMAIIQHSKQDYTMISAVLERICQLSYSDIRPYYFEKIVKMKYLQDSISGKIFDMILESTTWDYADIYCGSVTHVRNRLWRGVIQNKSTVAVAYEQNSEEILRKYEQLDAWFQRQVG